MVCVIKDTADIYCFCKNWYDSAQEHLLFKLPPVSLKPIKKFLHFSFKTAENFSNSKPRPPGRRKLDENPTSKAARTCESRGSPGGGWSGLDLTDRSAPYHHTSGDHQLKWQFFILSNMKKPLGTNRMNHFPPFYDYIFP